MKRRRTQSVRSVILPLWLAAITVIAATTAVGVTSHTTALARPKKEKDKEKKAKEAAPKVAKAIPVPSPYLELKHETTLARYSRRTIKDMLRGKEPLTPLFDEFFVKWFFPQLTQLENRERLPELRDQLQEYYLIARRNQTSTDRLNDLSRDLLLGIALGASKVVVKDGRSVHVVRRLGSGGKKRDLYWTMDHQVIPMKDVAKRVRPTRDFDMTVRYNAMLLVAGLNGKPAYKDTPAEPWLDVLQDLLKVAHYDQAPQSIRVAALIGVARHANVPNLDGAIKETIASRMAAIIDQPAEGNQAPDGDAWIRRQAIDILGRLQIPGAANRNVTTLGEVIADQDKPLPLRSAAAGAMGAIDVTGVPPEQASNLTDELIRLAIDCCRHESSGSINIGEVAAWQQLTFSVQKAFQAIRAFHPLLPEDKRQVASEVEETLNSILNNGANQGLTSQDRTEMLANGVAEIEQILSGEGAAEKPGTDAEPKAAKPVPVEPPADFEEF